MWKPTEKDKDKSAAHGGVPKTESANPVSNPQRSGDVVYVLKPYTFTGDAGTTHGSPWHYDRHVPLMVLSNRKLVYGQFPEQVSPASIAPTLARILHIETPAACAESRLQLKMTAYEISQ